MAGKGAGVWARDAVARTTWAASGLHLPSGQQENEQTGKRSSGLGVTLERYHSGEPFGISFD